MKFLFATAVAFAAGTCAAPATLEERAKGPTYRKSNPVIRSTCPAFHLTRPTNPAFPIAVRLGTLISPIIRGILGSKTVDEIDAVADQLCVSAQQDPADGPGVCQSALDAIYDFVDAKTPLSRSKQLGCLLNYICVAHSGPKNEGTCNQLLGVSDCIANRLIGDDNPECTS